MKIREMWTGRKVGNKRRNEGREREKQNIKILVVEMKESKKRKEMKKNEKILVLEKWKKILKY